MPKDRTRPDRQTPRLRGFDYRTAGYYSVTICTRELLHEFGHIQQATMILNEAGRLAQMELQKLPERIPGISIDQFVIMPNHVHCIILIATTTNIVNSPDRFRAHMQTLLETRIPSLREPYQPPKLGEIIRSYKAATTHSIRQAYQPYFAWHASYYDTILTNDSDLCRLRRYIQENPANWDKDKFYGNPHYRP